METAQEGHGKEMNAPSVKKPSEVLLANIHALSGKKGSIAVIEPETSDYFIGKTLTEALQKAKKKYPGRVFYSIRIGSTFVHEHKGGIGRQNGNRYNGKD